MRKVICVVALFCSLAFAQEAVDTLTVLRSSKSSDWRFVTVRITGTWPTDRELVLEYEGLDWDEFGAWLTWYRSPGLHLVRTGESGRELGHIFSTPLLCVGSCGLFLKKYQVTPETVTAGVIEFLPESR